MMGLNQFAELTGKAPKTIRKLLAPITPKHGPNRSLLWETKEALPLIYGITANDGERLDPQQEKARLDRERRMIVELERAEKEGRLVDVDVVRGEWLSLIAIAKSRFLALPTRQAQQFIGLSELREAESRLRAVVHDGLSELACDVRAGDPA